MHATNMEPTCRTCATRYGDMEYRTISRVASKDVGGELSFPIFTATAHSMAQRMSAMLVEQGGVSGAASSSLDVIFVHGMASAEFCT